MASVESDWYSSRHVFTNHQVRTWQRLALVSTTALAQNPATPQPTAPMTFFVTSVGKGDGANLGGLAGADAHCAV